MKKTKLMAVLGLAACMFAACDDDVSSAGKSAEGDSAHVVDTLYMFSKDTVVIRDSVFVSDTVVVMDSLILWDTLYLNDSTIKKDSSCIVTEQGEKLLIRCSDKDPYIYSKASCDGKAYDPLVSLCYDKTIIAIENADSCGTAIYDSTEYFCSTLNKVVKKCNGEKFNADSLFCGLDSALGKYVTHERCDGEEYDFNKFECENNKVIGYCGERKFWARVAYCADSILFIIRDDCSYGADPMTGVCYPNITVVVPGCIKASEGHCTACDEGYMLENGQCNYDMTQVYPGCAASSEGRCTACKEGFHGSYCDPNSCQHGTALGGIDGDGLCVPGSCEGGWAGSDCDQCAEGYSGENCDIKG